MRELASGCRFKHEAEIRSPASLSLQMMNIDVEFSDSVLISVVSGGTPDATGATIRYVALSPLHVVPPQFILPRLSDTRA